MQVTWIQCGLVRCQPWWFAPALVLRRQGNPAVFPCTMPALAHLQRDPLAQSGLRCNWHGPLSRNIYRRTTAPELVVFLDVFFPRVCQIHDVLCESRRCFKSAGAVPLTRISGWPVVGGISEAWRRSNLVPEIRSRSWSTSSLELKKHRSYSLAADFKPHPASRETVLRQIGPPPAFPGWIADARAKLLSGWLGF